MSNWQDKVVLVTGANSGIGLAITKQALAHGAKVSVLCRRISEQLQTLLNFSLMVHQGDVSQLSDVEAWVTATMKQHKKVDIIINNAGVMYYANCKNAVYEQMVDMINTNCLGHVNLCQVLMPILGQQRSGHWINITSDAGKQPFPGLAVYSGTKAFIEFTSRAMRQELLNDNIKITNIQPGNVKTKLHDLSTDDKSRQEYGTEDHGQYLRVEDIVSAIEYAVTYPHVVAVNEILIQPLTEST